MLLSEQRSPSEMYLTVISLPIEVAEVVMFPAKTAASAS